MKDNKSILNEAFFKKQSYEEKRAKKMPQYTPVDLKKSSGYSSNVEVPGPAYQVTDTEEVKRRLGGAFGVMFGNNNVRSMASRAIKEFPIIISDAVEPETAIMIKKLVEEQYAEYINLLISNQVVNLADFKANDEEGNIAIQALDTISGSNFKRSRVADKLAKSGNIDADTVFQNIPLYNLLRENQMDLKTGDSITDTLLEGAVVIPSEAVEQLVEFLDFNSEEIFQLNESTVKDRERESSLKNMFGFYSGDDFSDNTEKYLNKDMNLDARRGFQGLDDAGKEIYTKLTTGDIVLDEKRLDQAINRSVGELLTRPENIEIRNKFEKATFLLQSRRISGLEYYQYLTMRLGIPVSDSARMELIRRFKIGDIRKYGQGATEKEGRGGYLISKDEIKAIAQNRVPTEKIVKKISQTKLRDALIGTGIVGASAGIGLAIGNATVRAGIASAAEVFGNFLAGPFGGILIGAAVGGGAFLLSQLIRKIKEKKAAKLKANTEKIQGWERVEKLIKEMELQQAEAMKPIQVSNDNDSYKDIKITADSDLKDRMRNFNKTSNYDYDKIADHGEEMLTNAIASTRKMVDAVLTESIDVDEKTLSFNEFIKNIDDADILKEAAYEVAIEHQNDKHLRAEILTEKTLAKTSMPMTVKYVEKKTNKDIMITPSFMARDNYAYGSTEIDRKALKDRRYNQPLIMTVRFKERFDDGRYSDNELTAVIGILGKIIRIPSAEMEYILKESANGKTIEGIFSTEELGQTIEDMFSGSKISKDLKNLPQSADIWRNLEKVATLAAANKISGKRNGNISNAHIVFSQKEIDAVRTDTGIDFLKDVKKSVILMKRYSAFTLMVANDAGQRMTILDDQDSLSWEVVPYSALSGKDSGEQLNAALAKMARL